MYYDIILQNNASKEFFVVSGLQNTSSTELYLQFEEVDLPEEAQDGEYTYACLCNEESGVTYSPKTPILDTIVTIGEEQLVLGDLKPLVGLLRVGKPKESNVYDNTNNKTFYYEG